MSNQLVEEWRIETNDRYNKVVSSVTSLSTGAFALPALFLRQFLGVPAEKAILPMLTWAAYISWVFLFVSILAGVIYSWRSVKWVKLAYGQQIKTSEKCLESQLDWIFGIMAVAFLLGLAFGVWFLVTVRPIVPS